MDSRDKWDQTMDHVPSQQDNTTLSNSKILQTGQLCSEAAGEPQRHVLKRSLEDQIMEPATKRLKTECNVKIKLEKTEDLNIKVEPSGDTKPEQQPVQIPIPADIKLKVEVESDVEEEEESFSDQESAGPSWSSPEINRRGYLYVRSDLYSNNREFSDFSSAGSSGSSSTDDNAVDHDAEYEESAREHDMLERSMLVLLDIATGMLRLSSDSDTRRQIICVICLIVIQLRRARNRRLDRGDRS